MITYLKLLLLQKRFIYKHNAIVKVKDIFKYMMFSVIMLQDIYLLLTSFSYLDHPVLVKSIMNGKVILVLVIASAAAAHFSIKLTTLFSIEPFWKFNSKNQWFIKSYIYPLFSSTLLIIFLSLFSFFKLKGIVYFLILYLTYHFAYRSITFRIAIILFAFLSIVTVVNENVILMLVSAILLIAIIYDRIKLDYFHLISGDNHFVSKIESIFVKKEVKYLRYYKSESYYMGLSLAFFSFLTYMIFNLDSGAHYNFLIWCYIGLSVLPFSLTIFNLLGMDTNALPRYTSLPQESVDYFLFRIRYYQVPIYILNIFAMVAFFIITKDMALVTAYFLGCLAFNEILLFTSLIFSLNYIEVKEVKFRYGQYFKSKNVNIMQLIIFGLAFTLYLTYYFLNLAGIISITVIALFLNSKFLKPIALLHLEKMKRSYI